MKDGTVYSGKLPSSDKPWRFAVFGDRLVCTNPDHEPIVLCLWEPSFVLKLDKELSPWAIST